MPTRSGLRLSRPNPPPTCSHCGVRGHISTVCPRSSYSPDIPALSCPHCIRTVRSGQSNEPDGTQIVVIIDPCSGHSSPVVRPRSGSLNSSPDSSNRSCPAACSSALSWIEPHLHHRRRSLQVRQNTDTCAERSNEEGRSSRRGNLRVFLRQKALHSRGSKVRSSISTERTTSADQPVAEEPPADGTGHL